jgi:hypothetical protein
MSVRVVLLALFVALFWVSALGQSTLPPNPNEAMGADKPAPNSKSVFDSGSAAEEMHVRRAIRLAEKDHLENLDRAREAAKISAELKTTFITAKVLSPADRKKLDKIEKLMRRIRSEAGGSDSEVTLDQVPKDLESALTRIADVSDQVRKEVEKTPRQVISACVIERANQLLEVIQYARRFSQ